MLIHQVKRGLAPLDELCSHVCSETDRALFDELVVRNGVIDVADFWHARPDVRAKAQQIVINVDGRPAHVRVLDMIAARKLSSSPLGVSADWMAAVLVENASLEKRWRETASSQNGGKSIRAFWRGVVRVCAQRAWEAEVVMQRHLERVDTLALVGVVHTPYWQTAGFNDVNADFIDDTFRAELRNTPASSMS